MGEVSVPSDKLWGAQTQRSFENFKIGTERMPKEVIHSLGILKLAAARANRSLLPQRMTEDKLKFIEQAALRVIDGSLEEHFPLVVWQTGSGTQSNMNLNEVISNLGNQLAGRKLLHPNDDVNMSQSSNDTFPTAMHLTAVLETEKSLIPSLDRLIGAFSRLEEENKGIVKSGRTHLEDATPIAFSQEISGWRSSLERCRQMILVSLEPLRELAIGATAVGTGLNAPKDFDRTVAGEISKITGSSFYPAENKFHALSSKSELVNAHGALKALACDLMKIANDIRWLSSGPRCGLG